MHREGVLAAGKDASEVEEGRPCEVAVAWSRAVEVVEAVAALSHGAGEAAAIVSWPSRVAPRARRRPLCPAARLA